MDRAADKGGLSRIAFAAPAVGDLAAVERCRPLAIAVGFIMNAVREHSCPTKIDPVDIIGRDGDGQIIPTLAWAQEIGAKEFFRHGVDRLPLAFSHSEPIEAMQMIRFFDQRPVGAGLRCAGGDEGIDNGWIIRLHRQANTADCCRWKPTAKGCPGRAVFRTINVAIFFGGIKNGLAVTMSSDYATIVARHLLAPDVDAAVAWFTAIETVGGGRHDPFRRDRIDGYRIKGHAQQWRLTHFGIPV